MNTEQPSKFLPTRVFYGGIAIVVVLLVADFLLLLRAQRTARELEIYCVLFTLATLSVIYRYHSANAQLKMLGARGVWFLIAILLGAAGVFLSLPPAVQPNAPAAPAAAAPGPKADG